MAWITDQRMRAATAALQAAIVRQFPDAAFEVAAGHDPDGLYLFVTVDLDDPDVVLDAVIEQVVALQVEQALPIHVIPRRTVERTHALLRAKDAHRAAAAI